MLTGAELSPATSAVCAEVALAEPVLLVAVTVTRRVEPTSELPRVSPLDVPPAMLAQLLPPESQRFHW